MISILLSRFILLMILFITPFQLSADVSDTDSYIGIDQEKIDELICRAIEERLEIEVELVGYDGYRWTEVLAPYALGEDCYGRELLVATRQGSPTGGECYNCHRAIPSQLYDATGYPIGITEMAAIQVERIQSVVIREEWKFRLAPNSQEAIDERLCRWKCRVRGGHDY